MIKDAQRQIRYNVALDKHNVPLSALSAGVAVAQASPLSVTMYAMSKEEASKNPNAPYRLVVVMEERLDKRWVGAPRKLCHTCTYEVAVSGATTKSLEEKPVLMVGIRDCRIKSKGPKILSKDETVALMGLVAGAPMPHTSAPLTIRELPAGFEHLGK